MRHTIPLLHAAWVEAGLFVPKELLELRTLESDSEANPAPRLSFVDRAMGSLGQGLSEEVGIVLNNKRLDKTSARNHAVLGYGVRLTKVGLRQLPHSGKPDQLIVHGGIPAPAISDQVKQLV